MNALLFASLMALSLVAPGVLAQDHAVKTHSFDVKAASISSLQAGRSANSWQSLTGQVLVNKPAAQAVKTVQAGMRWPLASFRIADNHGVRVGRVGLPVFMTSNNCDMCRPPAMPVPAAAAATSSQASSNWSYAYRTAGAKTRLAIGASQTSPAAGFDMQRNKAWL